jgi:hypothetical protein
MNPFTSLLRSLIDALPDQNPAARAAVYTRARDTLVKKLGRTEPAPSEAETERQLEKLRAAIIEIEQSFGTIAEQ